MNDENPMLNYTENTPISAEELTTLYESVQWPGYTDHPGKMEKLLSGSLYYLSAWEEGRLVVLIRTVGDNSSILYIQDIIVHPDFQRMQIGTTLVQKTLDKFTHIRQIVLLTDSTEKTKAFYTSLGFDSAEKLNSVAFIRMNWDA